MSTKPDVEEVAAGLFTAMGVLRWRLREVQPDSELSLSERSALSRLERGGPATPSALARLDQITPQAMGATLAELTARGLVERRPDPSDGRRVLVSLTNSGRYAVHSRRSARSEQLAAKLSEGFTRAELDTLAAAVPLIERLAEGL